MPRSKDPQLREALSGNQEAIASLNPCPLIFLKLKGQDVRLCLRNGTITKDELLTDLSKKMDESYPSWARKSTEIYTWFEKLKLTPNQLAILKINKIADWTNNQITTVLGNLSSHLIEENVQGQAFQDLLQVIISAFQKAKPLIIEEAPKVVYYLNRLGTFPPTTDKDKEKILEEVITALEL